MNILSLVKYIFAILISFEFGFFNGFENSKDVVKIVFLFIALESCVFLDCKKKRSISNSYEKKTIINATLPHIFSAFLIFIFNCRYGYGNTFGILGYEKNIGIFTFLNLPLEICVIGVFLSYVCLWSLNCIKIALELQYNRKVVITMFFLGSIAFVSCIFLWFSRQHLYDSLMLFTLVIYVVFYLIYSQIHKTGSIKTENSKMTHNP